MDTMDTSIRHHLATLKVHSKALFEQGIINIMNDKGELRVQFKDKEHLEKVLKEKPIETSSFNYLGDIWLRHVKNWNGIVLLCVELIDKGGGEEEHGV